ncbi:cutinase family protein [Nocardia sp. alder85J]|uniref:cutinase family protein n=1 Tax=Nocardia sp. alder85J TaxID=2862949 RepID=UPI001CD3BD41|nr:cutinase family protein [Nocardia sp. alder85J]MCX4098326.1 cutinase family protein [Nocardia sp. alder85J]
MVAVVPDLVQRSYIPYPAGFGGIVPGGGRDPYTQSVLDGLGGLDADAAGVVGACPRTMLAAVGYSQGAQIVSRFAEAVGAGEGPVAPDRIAGIALVSDPGRAPGSVLPGSPGQVTPDAAPGTTGTAVSVVRLPTVPAGRGIAADDAGRGYGALTGRVAEICADGDPVCAAPDHAAMLRIGAEIAAQATLQDPLAALASIQAVLSSALAGAWTRVLADDVTVGPGGVDYTPQATLAQRLTAAADPRTPAPTAEDTATAGARWAQITATVVADPVGQLPKLAGQLAAAWGQLGADDADLVDPAVWLRYADLVGRHTGYAATGQLAPVSAWLIALARDLAGSPS